MNYKRRKPKRALRYYYSQNIWNFKKSFKRDYLDKKEFDKTSRNLLTPASKQGFP